MRAMILLAEGFEECEALTPADVLMRAGIKVELISVTEDIYVKGSHGITVKADKLISEIDNTEISVLVLPGGGAGTEALASSFAVRGLIELAVGKGVYVAAICAAPSVLGRLGLLDARKVACYPGFEKYMPAANITGEKIEVDDIFITAEGMGVSLEFGLKIVELLVGQETSRKVAAEIRKIGA